MPESGMRRPPLASGHAPDQQPRRRVDDEGDDEEDQAELDERVAVNLRSRFGELVGYGRGDGERRVEERGRYLGPVSDDHRDGHRLAHRATEAQDDRAGDARPRVLEHDARSLPPGRSEREARLALRAGHGAQNVGRDRSDYGHDHDGENYSRRQHPEPAYVPLKDRQKSERRLHGRVDVIAEQGREHEYAPQAVNDRGYRGEQLHEER